MNLETTETDGSASAPAASAQAADDRSDQRRLSRIFTDLSREATGPISIGEIRDAMGDRSFAALLLLFAVLNLLPLPPGTTLVLGLPLVLISTQMVLGYGTAWLPRALLDKSIGADRFRKAAAQMVPRLERLERLVKPRRWPLSESVDERIIGAISLVLSIVVTLPIPLGNWLPAFSIALLGLALSERDGHFLAAGVVTTILSFVVIGLVFGTAGVVASSMLGFHFL